MGLLEPLQVGSSGSDGGQAWSRCKCVAPLPQTHTARNALLLCMRSSVFKHRRIQ